MADKDLASVLTRIKILNIALEASAYTFWPLKFLGVIPITLRNCLVR